MKSKFLKIAKCKSEAEFYKKYKTEEDFFKAHPEARKLIKKAQNGNIVSYSDEELNDNSQQSWGDYLAPKTPHTGLQGVIKTYAPMVEDVLGGLQQLGAEQDAVNKAKQQAALSGVQAQAALSKDVDAPNVIRRTNKKKMDAMLQPINPNELFPTYGVGTNILTSKNGSVIPKAQNGFSDFMTGSGGGMLTNLASNITGNNAGNKIGGGIGKAAGTIFGGPLGGAIGSFLGTAVGGLFDHSQEDIDKYNKETAARQNKIMGAAFANNIQAQNSSYMENGGNLTNPQTIIKFGEYDVKDLLAPDPIMDTLRAGGHLQSYTPPTEHAMEQYAMGGELQTHWGGHTEHMSHNPYLPEGGQTVMFRGQSHDESDNKGRTGIGITYGNNPVEVERGEPAVKLENGGQGSDLTVFGNLYANMAGEQYKNKKFKNIVADLSKNEAKQNKIINKSTTNLDNNPLSSTFDVLAMNSNKMMMMGANSKLKNLAEEKTHLAQVQNAINETAAEHSLVADDLAKGKATIDKKAMKQQAKNGKLLKAEVGIGPLAPLTSQPSQPTQPLFMQGINFNQLPSVSFKEDGIPNDTTDLETVHYHEIMDLYNKAKSAPKHSKAALQLQQKFHEYYPDIAENIITSNGHLTQRAKDKGYKTFDALKKAGRQAMLDSNTDEFFGPRTEQYIAQLQARKPVAPIQNNTQTTTSPTPVAPAQVTPIETKKVTQTPAKQNVLGMIASQLNPLFRQPVKNPLDTNQLIGENFALAHNQVDPVQANLYNPVLNTPYDISLQDQLNEITASTNAAKRMSGYDPAAQSTIAGQEAMAKQKVLGEQFRLNQAKKDQVYSQNRATLNDAQLKNLGILDQQYVRQNQAKSNAQALTQAALSSISDKIQKNKLETYGMNVYANQYPDYSFDNQGMLRKLPTFHQFDIPTVGSTTSNYKQQAPEGSKYTYNEDGTIEGMKKEKAKNGSIVKSLKSL